MPYRLHLDLMVANVLQCTQEVKLNTKVREKSEKVK